MKFAAKRANACCFVRIAMPKNIILNSRRIKTSPAMRGLFERCELTPRLFQIEETAQLLAARGMTQLAQRLGLDLADAFAGHVELLADLFQGVVSIHVDAEAHAQHLRLARSKAGEH